MAKEIVKTPLKKGKANFILIGEAKVNDYTFSMDNTYESSSWTDNKLNLGVDCGNGNTVYAEMSGGYFPNVDSQIYVHGIKEDANGKTEDFENRFSVDWEDRFDNDILETVADSCFITVGITKDDKDKIVYKKFLSGYDAVYYLSKHLENGMVVCIKGNMAYETDGEHTYIKKKITSITLSKAEPKDYKATFTQTILLDEHSVGKEIDKEKNTLNISAYCVDYIGKPKINGKKIEVKKNFAIPVNFEFEIGDNKELASKQLAKFFKAKKGEIVVVTVEGYFVEGGNIITITANDLPDDIKELIELKYYTEEEAIASCAVGNSTREKRMIIKRPVITILTDNEGNKKPTVIVDRKKYKPSDIELYSIYLSTLDTESEDNVENYEEISPRDESSSDNEEDEFLAMLNNI